MIISGTGTETSPVTTNINTLSIENGASVTIESSVTIQELVDDSLDNVCSLRVLEGHTLTAVTMGTAVVLRLIIVIFEIYFLI